MKALRVALCLLPAAMAASALTGCQAYARAWNAEHAREYGARPVKAPKKTTQAAAPTQTDGAVTIVQAGNPREDGDAPEQPRLETQAQRAQREQAEAARRNAKASHAVASAPAPMAMEAAAKPVAPPPTARATASARVAAPAATARTTAAAPSSETSATAARMNQRELNAMLRGTTDAQIIAMFLMVNDIDISYAKLALARSENPEVKAYARRMITDHAQVIAAVRDIVAREEIYPAENRLSRDMRDESAWTRDSLAALTGRAFDSAYVVRQVSYHRQTLSMIDDVLLPRARDGELLRAISTMRPAIAAHLAHAQQLEATLGISAAGVASHR